VNFEENFDMGENYYVKGEYKVAIEYFEKCLKMNKSNDCLNYIGCCYLGLEDYNAAIKIFNSIIVSNPNSERPMFNLGRVYLKQGELDRALDCFEKAITINPYSEDAYYYLGVYYQKIGDLERAKIYYQKSLELDNEQSETHLNLGMCYFKLNKYEKAINHFDLAYKYDNDCIDAIENEGLVYIVMKNYFKALDKFLTIYNYEPTNTENMMDVAHCYYKINDFENAIKWSDKVLLKDPDNRMAKKLQKVIITKKEEEKVNND